MKTRILTLLFLLSSSTSFCQQIIEHERLLSFEKSDVPNYITTTPEAKLKISTQHYKEGAQSLQWKFQKGSILSIKKNLHFEAKDETGKDLYLSTFIVWVYNKKPSNESIEFGFYKDGVKYTSFPFNINFSGWRAAWVCYERDMKGTPVEGMNEIRIKAPDKEGELFFDHLITAAKTDHRHQTADLQVPFVNRENKNHWLVVYENSLIKPDLPLEPYSNQYDKDFQTIENRFRSLLLKKEKVTEAQLNQIRTQYKGYEIVKTGDLILGKSIFFNRAAEAYERLIPNWHKNMLNKKGIEIKNYFDLMFQIANAYHNIENTNSKKELKEIFLNMYYHITDQGATYGSCMGNFTHYGYSFRGLYTAYFLMKEVLKEAGELEKAAQTMAWYSILNEIYRKPEQPGIDMDSFNTQTQGRMASILMMPNNSEKLRYLKSYARWIDNGCLPANGLAGAFKIDGGAFHHRNHYPAYAIGGLEGATNMIYLLSKTPFAVSEIAHRTVKNVLLTMRFYCNKLHFPLALSGRHPDGKGRLVPSQYAIMALSGTPDKTKEIDTEMAAAYLRLVSTTDNTNTDEPDYSPKREKKKETEFVTLFTQAGIEAESSPQGNIALGYGCFSVQRRENWSAIAKGHSRYLWAAEHYIANNLYGRYLSHGTLQIMKANNKKEVTPETSGWKEEGFDWNRIPGSTSIHLPFEELRAKIYNVDKYSGVEEMLYSDEAFAGGLSHFKTDGNFGMKLHEHDKYNGSHRANKSYHFFGDYIVALGSNIENNNQNFETETTVFQLNTDNTDSQTHWQEQESNQNYYIDHLDIGYFTPHPTKLIKTQNQISYRQNTGEKTIGNWISLLINHGKAPKNASYEYAIQPCSTYDEMRMFASNPPYKVVNQNQKAHIVKDINKNAYSYVCFEKQTLHIKEGLLLETDTNCLVYITQKEKEVKLSVAHPDLALYRGESDELLNENNERIERSIYSRPWIDNKSQEIPVTITIKGLWEVSQNDRCDWVDFNNNNTEIRFKCIHGSSIDVELTPLNN